MNTRHIIGSMAVLLLAGLGVGACGAVQPPLECTVARGAFAARYTLTDGGPTSDPCRKKKGELLGLYKYNGIVDPSAQNKQPDNSKATIAIKSATLGDVTPAATETYKPISEGTFPILPGPDGICAATTLSKAEYVTGTGTISYEWSNVRVLNKPEALGTQLGAELRYTEGGCTATYAVDAIWPARRCSEGCDSGLNPLFPVECNTDTGFCVLVGSVPQLKEQ